VRGYVEVLLEGMEEDRDGDGGEGGAQEEDEMGELKIDAYAQELLATITQV